MTDRRVEASIETVTNLGFWKRGGGREMQLDRQLAVVSGANMNWRR